MAVQGIQNRKRNFHPASGHGSQCSTSEQGFALVFILALLPLLVSGFTFLAVTLMALLEKSTTDHQCRQILFNGQLVQGRLLTELLQLNPKAKKLRLKSKSLKVEIGLATAAGQFYLAAALSRSLAKVKLSQAAVRARQQQILADSRQATYKSRIQWHTFLKSHRRTKLHNSIRQPPLAVHPVPPLSLSPGYRRVPRFRRAQTAQILWAINTSTWLSDWWVQWTQKISPTIHGKCAATLIYQEGKWLPTLNAAKY